MREKITQECRFFFCLPCVHRCAFFAIFILSEKSGVYFASKIMGIISDHFAAEIEKMKARHEADAVRVERRIKRAQELLDEIKRLNDEIA